MNLNELTQEQKRAIYLEEKAKEDNLKKAKENKKKEYKDLADETVSRMFLLLAGQSQMLKDTKFTVIKEFKVLEDLKKDAYDNKNIAKQKSHTYTTKDGMYSIMIGQNVNDGWDDTAEMGEIKIREFINSLAKDEDSRNLVDAIYRLLSKDKQGNLKLKSLYELENLAEKYNNDGFKEGVDILRKSYKPTPSSTWVKA